MSNTTPESTAPAPVALGMIPARIKTEETREGRAQTIDATFKEMERTAEVDLIDGPVQSIADPDAAAASEVPADKTDAALVDEGDPVDKFIKAQSRIYAEREKARTVLNDATQAHQQLQQVAQRLEADQKEVDSAKVQLRKLAELARTDRKKFAELMGFDTKQMIEDYASGRHETLPRQDEYKNAIRDEMRAVRQAFEQERQAMRAEREQEVKARTAAEQHIAQQRIESEWIQTGADVGKYPILSRMTPAQRLKYGNEGADELRAAGVPNFSLHDVAKHVESSLRRLLSGDSVVPSRDSRERQASGKPTSMAALTSRATAEPAVSSSGIRSAAERRRDALAAFDQTGGIFSND